MRKIIKIILYIIGSILLLLIIVMLLLQTPWGKNIVRTQAVSYLQKKLKTEVRIDKFDYTIPDKISLGGVFIRDKHKDTLLDVGNLAINLDMFGLIRGKIAVDNILLENVNSHIYRNKPDTVFNYNFIIEAFAGKDTAKVAKVDTAKSKPLNLRVGKVTLRNIRLVYNDQTGGTFFSMNLVNMVLRLKKLDLDKMKFDLDEFSVSRLQSYFATDTSYLPPKPKDTAAPADFKLTADKIHFDNISFSFFGKQDSTFFGINLGSLDAVIKQFGLLDQKVELNTFHVEHAQSSLAFGKSKGKEQPAANEKVAKADTTSMHWRVNAAALMLNKIAFSYDDNAAPRMASGMDYSHLNFQGFSLNVDKVLYSNDTISGNLKHAAVSEKCGLNIIEFRTNFLYCNQGALLQDLYLLTPGTELQKFLFVRYPSIAAIQKDMNQLHLDIDIEKSKVSMKDVLLFMQPAQKKMLLPYAAQKFNIATKLNGQLNALNIQNFTANGLNGTAIAMNGKLNGLPNQNKINYNFNIRQLKSTYKDIAPFLTDSVKMMVSVPDWFMVNGHISGTTMDYNPDMVIQTSDGDATVNGSLQMSPGKGREKYNMAFSAKELNLGKILRKDSMLGKVTMNAKVNGTSFDVNTMSTAFQANVQSLWAMNYNYNGIHLGGNIADKAGKINGNSTDPNLDFTLDALFNLKGKYPAVTGDLNIANLDPQALGFYKDTMKFKGNIHADFTDLNPDYPSGLLSVDHPTLKMAGYQLALDSIYMQSKPDEDSLQDIYMNVANVLHLDLTGHIPLTQMGNAFLAHINNHYHISDSSFHAPTNYDFVMNLNATYRPVLKTWLPDLKPFDTIKLRTVVRPDTFSVYGLVPRLINGTTRLDSAVVKVFEAGDTLRYGIAVKRMAFGQFQLWQPSIAGSVRKDSIYTKVVLKDSTGKDQFAFGAAATHDSRTDSGLTYVRIFKGMMLNYDTWNINPANRFVLGPKGFYVTDFAMTNADQAIKIQSDQAAFGAPIKFNINNFSLANVTRMISRDTLVADGRLNADMNLQFRDSFPDIAGTASIKGLLAYNKPVGDLDVSVKNSGANIYNLLLKLSGNQNDVALSGDYYLQPVDSNNFKMNLKLNALNLQSLEGFTFGSIKNSSGFIKGQLDISGTVTTPKITGELTTDNLKTTVSKLGSPYSMPSEKLTFDNTGITFDKFTIYDSSKHKLTIDGTVKTHNWTTYFLDLDVAARKWLAINSTKKDNEAFYGKLIISSDLTLKGPATSPTIEGSLKIHDSTRFTYAMIDQGPSLKQSEGIVRFIDSRDTTFIDSTQIIAKTGLRVSRSSSMNINVAIEKNATFNVVIDPMTGDNLQVRGEANLNTEIGADGSVGLTGTYELDGGYYELHYNFITKKFKIQSGSNIALAGNPMDAEVDITAVFDAAIAPYELVEKQVDQADLNKYKQNMPFQIVLKLKGKVLKPDISFDIVLPTATITTASTDVTDNVQRKLSEIRNDPSLLNKQVFAALILGRFVTDDPFESSSGGGLESAARQSASRFLSDQLNNLAGQLVKGVELNVGLQTSDDYSTGDKINRTDLNVSASKKLFSDRLNVTIGNDFQLEGQPGQTQQSSLIPGNLSADYMLTKDGKYVLRGYRVNQLQNIIDGYVIETGVSFRLTLEYNRFKNIFKKKSKQQKEQDKALKDKATAVKREEDDAANKKAENTQH
jgi:translocation and assembly module TamB